MSILKLFTVLNAEARHFLNIYSEISDRYRVSDFGNMGISEFIETSEGQKMINELSKSAENINTIINELIDIMNKMEINLNEETKEINNILIDFAITLYGITGKNIRYKNNHIININEKDEIDKYYEKFMNNIKSLNKILSERKKESH